MKKLMFLLLALTSFYISARAQTAQEILSRMEDVFEAQEDAGTIMTIDTSIPIMGKSSALTYSLGEKMRMETKLFGVYYIAWGDEKYTWTYTPEKNEVEITNNKADSSEEDTDDLDMFMDIDEGYDVSIKKETADAWHIHCVKRKSNKDEDAPKKIEIVIAKGTFHPITLKAKSSIFSVVIRDIKFGVSEKEVTFDANDYPGIKIIDKR